MARLRWAVCTLLLVTGVGLVASTDDPPGAASSLTVARELYAAAEYESALSMLDRLRGAQTGRDVRSIEQYRAYCLLALGRSADAEEAIAAVVLIDPAFLPAESDMSPRLRGVFRDVRRRTLPAAAQQSYERAKSAFDRKDFPSAASGFSGVLQILDDQDLREQALAPPLSDLKVLSAGFRDLAVAAVAPPPPAPFQQPPVNEPATPQPNLVYTAEDQRVTPPVTIRQGLPQPPSDMVTGSQGAVEVVISEAGTVERVVMRRSLGSRYDRLVLETARQWKYEPAMFEGRPVKFRKVVQITVNRAQPPVR